MENLPRLVINLKEMNPRNEGSHFDVQDSMGLTITNGEQNWCFITSCIVCASGRTKGELKLRRTV